MAIFNKPAVKGRDDFYLALVCQCSSYCQQQEFGADSQLQLIISQWCDGIKIKEDVKDVKISSDVRKQVNLSKNISVMNSTYIQVYQKRQRLNSDDSLQGREKKRRKSSMDSLEGDWSN